jgi:lipopolysaccharide export system permease protein
MFILDRYLLRQFVKVFFICSCSLTGLYMVIDAFTHLDEFLTAGEKTGNLFQLIAGYYAYRAVMFFDLTSGVLAMVAGMFTVVWIQRHNELTAMLAAGISRWRVVVPIVVAVAGVNLAAVANRELVIPEIADELAKEPRDLAGDNAREYRPRYDRDTDILFRGQCTYGNEQRLHRPSLLLPSNLDRYGSRIVATDAWYRPAEGNRPSGYLLTGVSEPASLAQRASLSLHGQPVLITPHDAPEWLRDDECFVVSQLTFEQLASGQSWRRYSSTYELVSGLRNPSLDYGNDVRVLIHSRLLQPLADMTLLFLALPVVLARDTRNVFLAIGQSVGVVGVFLTVGQAAQYLGSNYLLSPALAAWLPLMIFVPAAVHLSASLER